MKTARPMVWSIKKLHSHLLEGRFAIPKLQRNFVWDGNRAARLLDSIYREIPIGSLLLWEMSQAAANLVREAHLILPDFDKDHKKIWFVIDGQQRLSVIYQAFAGEPKKNDARRDIYFDRLCFVINPDQSDPLARQIVYRKAVSGQFVAIRDMLSPHWRKRVGKQPVAVMNKIQDCRKRLLEYVLPIVTIEKARRDEIVEVFTRVNSLGMNVTSAERAMALMGELDAHDVADKLRHTLDRNDFKLGSVDPLLMGFSFATQELESDGDPPKLEKMARHWSKKLENDDSGKKEFEATWKRYQDAVLRTVDYLKKQFPVYDESFLPSANMVSTLAVFFFHHHAGPDPVQASEIRKWFWVTGVAKRYSGQGYHRNLVADARMFRDFAHEKNHPFLFKERLDPALTVQAEQYNAQSARTRAFFCLLASLKPRYLDTGNEMPLGPQVLARGNQTHRHHIFPKKRLIDAKFSPTSYNSLCNLCLLAAEINESIGYGLPKYYLNESRSSDPLRFASIMRSHLIPVSEGNGVWEPSVKVGYKQFRKERLNLICAEFEKAAGIKIFSKD